MSPVLWYFSRATGLVSLALFMLVVVLGCVGAGRFANAAWPRLTTSTLHRNLALTSLGFLALHIGSAIIDSYVPLAWIDVIFPFVSAYEPLWVGLGSTAIDLMLAIVITSLLRTRIPPRAWRAVHWLAYLCWPVALVHGIGMVQTDPARGWILTFDVLCVMVVAVAVVTRAMSTNADAEARKLSPLRR
jgi:DMSO/TMAO reductase YedYZ heme-binding membrane subunit